MNYRILDAVLCPTLPLPELRITSTSTHNIQVSELHDGNVMGKPQWLHYWLEEGKIAISVGAINTD